MSYQHIFNRLRQAGLTEAAALGFLGNWQQESGCEPGRIQNDFDPYRTASRVYTARVISGVISRQQFGTDQKGYGLAQWTYVDDARTAGRKFDMYDFWARDGRKLDNVDLQIDFTLWELHHGYAGVWGDLVACTDLWTATDIICRRFEQPANNNVGTRYGYAQEIRKQIDVDAWQQTEEPASEPEEGGQSMTKTQAINKALDIARAEIGYPEKDNSAALDDFGAVGHGNYTKYARDLDRIPVFVKAGSVLPVKMPGCCTDAMKDTPIEAVVYPGADGIFDLYEDAGDGYGYRQGEYCVTRLQWKDKAIEL